jgi:WD40 repeat protein
LFAGDVVGQGWADAHDRTVFDSARQVLKGEDIEEVRRLEWLSHGPYLLKGLADPVEICEVREAGQQDGGPPTSSEKAQRQVRADEESVLGWRPAVGDLVPSTRWILDSKLGEGGFGEVWVGHHQHTKERRVFKFCFHAERVRFLKREMTLFRLVKERFGDHPHIVRLHDVNLEQAPFYVEMDYVAGADLRTWCEAQGGIQSIALGARLEIVAQAAEALQAAHEAGIIHRDIKPANILIGDPNCEIRSPNGTRSPKSGNSESPASFAGISINAKSRTQDTKLQVKLTDFGIGQVVSEEYLKGITRAGFTQTMAGDSSSGTGTQLYMAPELLAGKQASTRSDIYSLGVVLFQLLVGDFTQPLTTDWTNHILDPLLREDLRHCFAGDPQERFAAAAQLAEQLGNLPQRRKARRRRAVALTACIAAFALCCITLAAGYALRRARVTAATLSCALYVADMNLAQQAWDEGNLQRAQAKLGNYRRQPGAPDYRGFEWRYLWKLCRDESRWSTNFPAAVQEVTLSPDRRLLAAGGGPLIRLLDSKTRRTVSELAGPEGKVRCLAFSPRDTNLLAVAGDGEGAIRVCDLSSGKPDFVLQGYPKPISRLAYSSDGKFLVAAYNGNALALWNVDLRTNVWLRHPYESVFVQAAVFAPNNQTIVSGGGDSGNALLWDASTGNLIAPFPLKHTAWINSIAFSPDGRIMATVGNDSRLVLWDFSERRPIALPPVGHRGNIYAVAFSPDQKLVATGGVDHTVRIWDLSLQKSVAILRGHAAAVLSVAFAPDGRTLFSASADGSVKEWNLDLDHRPNQLNRHEGWVSAASFSPDGTKLATVDWHRGSAFIWDLPSGKVSELAGHTKAATCGTFSPDGRLLATGSQDQTVRIWDWSNGRSDTLTNDFSVHCIAFCADGKVLVAAGMGLAFWNIDSRQRINGPFRADNASIVAVTKAGHLMATGDPDGTVRLWRYPDGQCLVRFQEQTGFQPLANPLTFSEDATLLASGDDEGRVVLYDVRNRRVARKIERAHTAEVWSLAFVPDGKTLVSGGGDASIVFWNLASYESALTLNQHLGPVAGLAFTRDGNLMASCGADAIVRLWPASPSDAN